MDFFKEGESIEGASVAIYARKIVAKTIKNVTIGRVFNYTCDRNTSAEIRKILPKGTSFYSTESNKNLKDKLRCEAMELFHLGNKKLPKTVNEGKTATHGGEEMYSETHTFAKIKYPFEQLANAFRKKALVEQKELDKRKSIDSK